MFIPSHILSDLSWEGWGLGVVNMFIENCAKIRGKLAGNWRHLQNKGEDGEEVVWGVMKEEIELASTHVFVVGGF